MGIDAARKVETAVNWRGNVDYQLDARHSSGYPTTPSELLRLGVVETGPKLLDAGVS